MHSKIRRKRFGYPTFPTVGHKSPRATSGLIEGMKPIVVENISQLYHIAKNEVIVLSRRLGAKKRIDVLKKVEEMKLPMMQTRGKK
jgi:ribosomal protein L32E